MPRPLLVVASGKTTMTRDLFCLINCLSSMSESSSLVGANGGGGWMSKQAATALSRVRGRTSRVPGWLEVKIGSKIAAR